MKRKIFNHLGMTLVETLIAMGVAGALAVTVGSLTSSTYKIFKEVSVNQTLNEFKTLIQTTTNSSNKCPTMILGTINPASVTETILQGLVIPPNLQVKPGYSISAGSGLNVTKVSFKKLIDTYGSGGGSSTFVAKEGGIDYTYYPIAGNILIEVESLAVKQNKIAGQKLIQFGVPISITFRRSGGGAWSIFSCNSEAPITILKEAIGWENTNLSDPNFCQVRSGLVAKGADGSGPAITSGTVTCPQGLYLVSQTSRVEKRMVPIYVGECSCSGSCRDCVCVAGSSCSTNCDRYNGNITSTNNNCMGTCDAHNSCKRIDNGEAVFYYYVDLTCCKVRRE